ncbi:MAG: GLPGLI family protein [Prevotella sp.]|nr:GLPGLI family protein [Prevotella sp.]
MRKISIILILSLLAAVVMPIPAKTKWYKRTSLGTYVDTVLLKVFYVKNYKETLEDQDMKEDICRLSIGTENVVFDYAYGDFFMTNTPPELTANANNPEDSFEIVQKYTTQASRKYIGRKGRKQYLKNYPEKGLLRVYTGIFNNGMYIYEESIPTQDWQLEEGDSVVCGYTCNKATTTFQGRTWNVWYTLDIPYSEGPWKLGGLPGLILKVTDTTGEFDFTAISIQEEKRKEKDYCLINILDTRLIKITPSRYEQMLRMMYDDEVAFNIHLYGAEHANKMHEFMYGKGIPLKTEHKTPCLIEYYGKEKE